MPRIPTEILDCAIYLYPSKQSAIEGEAAGGSGFIVGFPFERKLPSQLDWWHVYAVTNSHVIRQGKSTVIRLNTLDDGIDIIETNPQDWHHHDDGDDVAVYRLSLRSKDHKFNFIHRNSFISRAFLDSNHLGAGSDVFSVGRFVNHEGRQRNLPVVRFGNIAMMPWEAIINENSGLKQESFLIESRSLPGFSGSPVFFYVMPGDPAPGDGQVYTIQMILLLGIDWGHLRTHEYVLDKTHQRLEDPEFAGWNVQSNSGTMAVVPAWKLEELLETKELKKQREKDEEEIAERYRAGATDDEIMNTP